MTNAQLEEWVLSVVRLVRNGGRVEDSRVELKAQLPDPPDAARRLAGHLNAARGEPALWIIGIDEKTTDLHAISQDHLKWFQQVRGWFDGAAPEPRDMVVPCEGGSVLALFFRSDRAPYVVGNPRFGKAEGGPVEREVPWRELTSVRSSRRADLLQILVPRLRQPEVEILDGQVQLHATPQVGGGNCFVFVDLYLTPIGRSQIVYPFHRCKTRLLAGSQPYQQKQTLLVIGPPGHAGSWVGRSTIRSHTIRASDNEVLVNGPGLVQVTTHLLVDSKQLSAAGALDVSIELLATGSNEALACHLHVVRVKDGTVDPLHWRYSRVPS